MLNTIQLYVKKKKVSTTEKKVDITNTNWFNIRKSVNMILYIENQYEK